jgi:hypothetical protein
VLIYAHATTILVIFKIRSCYSYICGHVGVIISWVRPQIREIFAFIQQKTPYLIDSWGRYHMRLQVKYAVYQSMLKKFHCSFCTLNREIFSTTTVFFGLHISLTKYTIFLQVMVLTKRASIAPPVRRLNCNFLS